MQKVVLKLNLHDDRDKQKALEAVSTLHGMESIAMDMKEQKMTVIGSADPIHVVNKLRKFCPGLVSVGPAKEEKKEGGDKKDGGDKEETAKHMVYPLYYPQYVVHSAEEDPNSCVIC